MNFYDPWGLEKKKEEGILGKTKNLINDQLKSVGNWRNAIRATLFRWTNKTGGKPPVPAGALGKLGGIGSSIGATALDPKVGLLQLEIAWKD